MFDQTHLLVVSYDEHSVLIFFFSNFPGFFFSFQFHPKNRNYFVKQKINTLANKICIWKTSSNSFFYVNFSLYNTYIYAYVIICFLKILYINFVNLISNLVEKEKQKLFFEFIRFSLLKECIRFIIDQKKKYLCGKFNKMKMNKTWVCIKVTITNLIV